MTLRFYTHASFQAHDPGPGHPECPARLTAVVQALRAAFPQARWNEAPRAARDAIARVHAKAVLATVLDDDTPWPRRIDADTVMSEHSAEAALRACGAGIAAVDEVMADPRQRVFCAVRPPGHHAMRQQSMGFCLFNSIAVAAAHALAAHGLQRVSIIDFDVHHGNGTQDIFAGDARVQYLSSHQQPLYPGTGFAEETGVGNIGNVGLPPGSGGAAFRDVWQQRLLPQLDAFAPQLLLVSAGFDAHRLDPLADLELEADDYQWIGRELAACAGRHAQGRLAAMLEGGYSLTGLRESSVAFVRGISA